MPLNRLKYLVWQCVWQCICHLCSSCAVVELGSSLVCAPDNPKMQAQPAFVASLPSLFLEICGAWELVADTSKEQWGKQTYYKPAQGQSINELIH